jgi:hypothetical protein
VITEPEGKQSSPTLNTSINVTVNSSAGQGGQSDPRVAKDTGDVVAKMVEVKFSEFLQKQLRPGGLLNAGRA